MWQLFLVFYSISTMYVAIFSRRKFANIKFRWLWLKPDLTDPAHPPLRPGGHLLAGAVGAEQAAAVPAVVPPLCHGEGGLRRSRRRRNEQEQEE